MNNQYFESIVEESQRHQNRSNILLAAWLMVEAGELSDLLVKREAYDKEVDKEKLVSEAGDVLHFVTIILQRFGLSLNDAMANNCRKLKDRGWVK